MRRVGLLEPIVVNENGGGRYHLVAGERRVRAAMMLQWSTIPASLQDHLSASCLRDMELEENENRKPLTEVERRRTFGSSKRLVENARKAADIISGAPPKKDPRGRKAKGKAPREETAAALGIDERSLRRAEQHVEAAEAFPFMQGEDWRQSDVLRVRERLVEAPPKAREQIIEILGVAKVLDPELAVQLVENIAAKPAGEREEIYRLSQSEDSRERSLALTKAAEQPPMPDPRIGILDKILQGMNAAINPFPKDPLTPRLSEIRQEIVKVRAAVKEVSYDARRAHQKAAIQ
jgi:hypothetical protein